VAEQQLEISFPGVDDKTAGALRDELQEFIASNSPGTKFSRKRTDSEAQDVGTILIILLGSKVGIEMAKGIADWLRQRTKSKLVMKVGDNTIEVDNVSVKSAQDLTNKLSPLLSGSAGSAKV
jgi:hypothetical protein